MASVRRLRLVARPPSSTVEDRWFAALDGQLVRVETAVCPLTVLGIHRGARDVWIQLAPFVHEVRGLVLRCDVDLAPMTALYTLRGFLIARKGNVVEIVTD